MTEHKRDNRYYTLDFWRGVACLMVVVYHSSYYFLENPLYTKPQGIGRLVYFLFDHLWVGVPMFFVISGYCITAACENARRKNFSVAQYFSRRLKRIYPPYWIAIILVLGFSGLLVVLGHDYLLYDGVHPHRRPSSFVWSQWIGNISLTEIWRQNIGGGPTRFFLGVAWTLCYEEQFYAICGLLLWLSGRFYFWACLGLSVLVVPLMVLFWGKPIGLFFDGRWLEFGCGIAVYYRVQCLGARNLLARWRVIEGSLLLMSGFFLVLFKRNPTQILEELFVSSGFAAVVILLFKYDRRMFAGLPWRWVWMSGIMCYSLYLVHAPLVKCTSHLLYQVGIRGALQTLFISVPVSVAVAFGAGWAFHCIVERRFLNTKPVELKSIFAGPTHPKSLPRAVTPGGSVEKSVSGLAEG